jgi:heptaprenyl diphosphate synthase
MQLPDNEKFNREIILKTSMLLLAIAVNALEFFIPRIPLFPWLKPGLANIITVIWIIKYGFIESLLYALLRIWIVSFYFGFSFVTFTLSFSGAVLSICTMTICWKLLGRHKILGAIGIAVIGAFFHNMGQLSAVYFLMAQNSHLFYQVPFMIIASVIFGSIVGLLVPNLYDIISRRLSGHQVKPVTLPSAERIIFSHFVISLVFLILCMALVFVTNETVLLIATVFVTFFVQFLARGSIHALIFPVKRFWMLFLFVGVFHSFFTYGTKYSIFPLITHEGLNNTIIQWMRLWAWLETSFIFLHYRFHAVLLKGLQKVFPGNRPTLYAGLLAAEYFPSVVDHVRSKSGKLLKLLFCRPLDVITELFEGVTRIVAYMQERTIE